MLFYGPFNSQWNDITNGLKAQGYKEIWEGDKSGGGSTTTPTPNNTKATNTNIGGGGGSSKPALDTAKIDSLRSFISSLDQIFGKVQEEATKRREASRREKDAEKEKQKSKYDSGLVEAEQGLGETLNDNNLNTANTLENLRSAMSVLGMGGNSALTRSVLASANQSNRKANSGYAKNKQELGSAWNEYEAGYKDDINKIDDQYNHDIGEGEKSRNQNKQNALYQIADVYNTSGDTGTRANLMNEANSLNSLIANSVFTNPSYTGTTRAMATPELQDLSADVGQYKTTLGDAAGAPQAGNVAVKAISVNNKDLGLKKKQEGNIAYGV